MAKQNEDLFLFSKAIVCEIPSTLPEAALRMENSEPVDLEKAHQQHREYIECVGAFGMARRMSGENFSLEQLEKEITCGICQEHYTDPKILPCLHYYCKQCLLRLALRTPTGEPFHCPECRCKVTLPEGGVEGLKSAFFVGRLESIWEGFKPGQGKGDLNCESCSAGKPSSFCNQCAKFICCSCVNAHQTMKGVFSGHKIVSIQDLNEGKAEAIAAVADGTPIKKCKLHNEELKLYCFHCDILICRDCTIVDHKEHKFQFSAVAAPEAKEKLMTELQPLKQVGEKLTQAVEKVKTTREQVEAQGVGVAQTINTSFDELVQIVEQRRKELLEEAERRVHEKVDKLTVQEKTLSLANAEVQSVVDYAERCVEHGTDNEVMSMQGKIRSQIEIVHKRRNPMQVIEPEVDVDIGVEVKCSEKVQQLCHEDSKITQLPVDLAQCIVTGEGIRRALINQAAEFTVIAATLTNGKPARHRNTEIVCFIKSLFNNYVIKCDVYEMAEPGCYRVSYTPSYRGRHELTVLVDKCQLPNCPFSVFVSILPGQLGKPVSILYDIEMMSGVSVTTSGITVVGKQKDDLVVFYKNDELVQSVRRNSLKLNDYTLVGIDVDSEDFIYFTLHNSSFIIKLDKEGTLVLKAPSKQNTTGNLGLAVVGEEVAVCPRYHKGTIMIYDRELNFVRSVIGKNIGELRDVSADSEGNLFVTDWIMNCVHVFSPNGVVLQSINFLEGIDNSFVKLRGICVSGQFVYVCVESPLVSLSGVYVLTTDGEYVLTIGSLGLEEGQFLRPYAVCVDRDGFVYINDSTRLQVF